MELAEGGDLFDKIEADEGVPEDIAHFYFTQLISAVGYMHSKGVAHRDIKPENVLLSSEGDLKLADFGLAALFKKDGKTRLCNSICGSPPYIAPEIVGGRRSRRTDVLDDGYAPNICDIWSSGVVLFVLLVGNTPWDEPTMNSEEFRDYVESDGKPGDELWDKLPTEMLSLLRGMLRLDPTTRFTLDEIRTHPWFTRKNKWLSSNGRNANPVGMATQMLSQLKIDFTRQPTSSPHDMSQYSDAMEIDSQPRRSSASPHNIINLVNTASQPETPIADTPFDWERPPRLSTHDGVSTSQPTDESVVRPLPGALLLSQLSSSAQDMLSQDPAMAQFSQSGSIPMTLTQAARKFQDVLPSHSMARFLSPLAIGLLVPLILDALNRLGVPNTPPSEEQLNEWEQRGEASIRIKMADGRRQGLNGHIVVEPFDQSMREVRFVKASGDPLEWRRFFKNVVLCVAGAVVRSG
jgi:serine/threonine-protein kinase Chk1